MELVRVAASNDNIDLAPGTRVIGFYLTAGADAASATIFDSLAQAGATSKFTIKAAAAATQAVLFGDRGVPFKIAISVTLTGTAPELFILVE